MIQNEADIKLRYRKVIIIPHFLTDWRTADSSKLCYTNRISFTDILMHFVSWDFSEVECVDFQDDYETISNDLLNDNRSFFHLTNPSQPEDKYVLQLKDEVRDGWIM